MYNTKPFEPRVRIINRKNQILFEYENFRECCKHIEEDMGPYPFGWGSRFGDEFTDETVFNDYFYRVQYVIRTEHGDVIKIEDVADKISKYRFRRNARRGRSVAWSFRRLKTFNEMKQWYALEDQDCDIPVKSRARRNPRNIPNSWDDYIAKTGPSWKDWRKTQYRVKT